MQPNFVCKSLIFQFINSFIPKFLKHERFTLSGCKDKTIGSAVFNVLGNGPNKNYKFNKRHKPNIYKYTVCNYLYGSSIFDCVLYTKLQKWRICNSKMYLSKKKVLSFDVLMFF